MIQRYIAEDFGSGLHECNEGDWVKYEDYKKLEEENERLKDYEWMYKDLADEKTDKTVEDEERKQD